MADPFVGEIRIFGFNFNPYQWAFCNGATMPISQNTALFSLLGTQYGGNGQTTYQLPNFAARAACSQGQGPALSPRSVGETFGAPSVALINSEMPSHNHGINAYSQPDATKRSNIPATNGGLSLLGSTTARPFTATPNAQFAPNMLGASGGSQPHENQQPYLAMNFCIALAGIFPPRP